MREKITLKEKNHISSEKKLVLLSTHMVSEDEGRPFSRGVSGTKLPDPSLAKNGRGMCIVMF